MTFGESLEHWLKIRSFNKSPRTVEFYHYSAQIIRKHWPALNMSTAAITLPVVLDFAQSVAHVCPSVWNTIVGAMRFITPHGRQIPKRRLRIREFTPPTQAEFARLVAEADALPRTRAGLVIRFLANTGLRIAEARALRWEEHILPDCIVVPAEAAKGRKTRRVPLTEGAREALEKLRALDCGGFVLPRQNPRKAIERACHKAGLPRLSVHCFRHLFATRCVAAGVDLPTLARWLGHADGGALLARTYFHLLDSHSQEMAQRVRV